MRSIIIAAHIFTVLFLMLALMPFWMMTSDAMDKCLVKHSTDTCVTVLR